MIEVQPCSGNILDDALGAQNDAIFFFVIQRGKNGVQLVGGELLRRFNAPALENFVGVVAVMMVVLVLLVLIVVMMMSAAAVAFIFMMMVVIMILVINIVIN